MGIEVVDGCQRGRVSLQRCDSYTRTIGRKRISIPRAADDDNHDDGDEQLLPSSSPPSTSCRKQHKRLPTSSNRLELLPQEILIRVLCLVNRSALKELVLVSKAVRNAALVAKESHFDVSTPVSKPAAVDPDEDEAPNAPTRVTRQPRRLSSKDLRTIAVALFPSPQEEEI